MLTDGFSDAWVANDPFAARWLAGPERTPETAPKHDSYFWA
jgi:hypothetical protein